MAHIRRLLNGRHAVENVFSVNTFVFVRIHRKISNAKRGQVLKEMSTLRRVYPIVLQSFLHDDTRPTDMRPLHRYAEPRVTAAPPSRSYQHIVLTFSQELAVDTLHIVGDGMVVHGGEVLVSLHIHHIDDILADSMPQRHVGTQQTVIVGNRRKVFIQHLLGVYDGTNLQEV